MSSIGPFTRAELDALRALCELHKDTSLFARESLRLITMIDARDYVIRELSPLLDAAAEAALEEWLRAAYDRASRERADKPVKDSP